MCPDHVRTPARNARGQLYLLFRLGADRYALDVRDVVEVLPLQQLKQLPEAPAWVAGVFSHRGVLVPVLDLGALAFGKPAKVRTSTRLVVVHYSTDSLDPPRWLGLILEQATDTLRCRPEDFQEYGLEQGEARYLGPVFHSPTGLVQLIRVSDLLTDAARELLFPVAREAL